MENLAFIFRVILYKGILGPFLKIIIGIKYRYNEDLNFDTPKIIVANHNSHVDAIAILCSLKAKDLRKVHPVVAKDYFYKTNFSRILAKLLLNSVGVSRKKEYDRPLAKCEELLQKGHSLIIFPEGTRGSAGEMKDFKHGVSILLKNMPEVEFVPVYCTGFDEIMPKGEWMLLPSHSSIRFGKTKKIKSHFSIQESTDLIRKSILELRH